MTRQLTHTDAPFTTETHSPIATAMAALLRTDVTNGILTLQRVALGALMFPHGAQKLLGWFGGPGYQATVDAFTQKMGIPLPLAVLVILSESIGSLMMICGLLTRVTALGTTAIMLVAIGMVHWKNGFFMNWMGAQAGEGFEYHLLVLALAVPLLVMGGGRWALDTPLAHALDKPRD